MIHKADTEQKRTALYLKTHNRGVASDSRAQISSVWQNYFDYIPAYSNDGLDVKPENILVDYRGDDVRYPDVQIRNLSSSSSEDSKWAKGGAPTGAYMD